MAVEGEATMERTPPSSSWIWHGRPVIAFERQSGTKGSTFYGRLIQRAALMLEQRDGNRKPVARYGGRYWPIYPPEAFEETIRAWVKANDLIYVEGQPLRLPLDHPFLFDCDEHLGRY